MRYARIRHDGRPRWVLLDGDELVLADRSPLESRPRLSGSVPLSGALLLPPVVPSVFYAVGMNYRSHIDHARSVGDTAAVVPERPEVGYRANNALIGHGQVIRVPPGVTGRFEAEGEVVAVIGRDLRRASRSEAQDAVFGWTIGNDISARQWQHADRTLWRSKNSDTFKPMGPWIETDLDPMEQTTSVAVDGDVRASFPTGAMIFDPWDYLVETSRYITIQRGDVLWMGSDATVQIEPGQTVEIAVTGIGTLGNPVEREPADSAGVSPPGREPVQTVGAGG